LPLNYADGRDGASKTIAIEILIIIIFIFFEKNINNDDDDETDRAQQSGLEPSLFASADTRIL